MLVTVAIGKVGVRVFRLDGVRAE